MRLAEAAAERPTRRNPVATLHGTRWQLPFRPLIRNGDLQTIAAHYWPRSIDERRYPTTDRLIRTDPLTKVLVRVNQQPGSKPDEERPTVLALHGLTACDHAPYMVSTACAALASGFDAVRMNMRNCGGTEHLCRTLYHSGQTSDLRKVAESLAPRPVYLVGFSMGGNVALKLAGEWGASPPEHVRGACAISPPVRLDMCSRNIGRPRNFVYERRFLLQLSAAMRRKHTAMPDLFPAPYARRPQSVWQFDETITAPAFGFRDAKDYYRQCSAARFLGDIRIPTLIIQARDDPFIPFAAFDLRAFERNPWLTLLSPRSGGHVAFLAKGADRFWAQRQTMQFFAAACA